MRKHHSARLPYQKVRRRAAECSVKDARGAALRAAQRLEVATLAMEVQQVLFEHGQSCTVSTYLGSCRRRLGQPGNAATGRTDSRLKPRTSSQAEQRRVSLQAAVAERKAAAAALTSSYSAAAESLSKVSARVAVHVQCLDEAELDEC
jgi:hypothetical protein